jgi:hypothetical protein
MMGAQTQIMKDKSLSASINSSIRGRTSTKTRRNSSSVNGSNSSNHLIEVSIFFQFDCCPSLESWEIWTTKDDFEKNGHGDNNIHNHEISGKSSNTSNNSNSNNSNRNRNILDDDDYDSKYDDTSNSGHALISANKKKEDIESSYSYRSSFTTTSSTIAKTTTNHGNNNVDNTSTFSNIIYRSKSYTDYIAPYSSIEERIILDPDIAFTLTVYGSLQQGNFYYKVSER